MTEPMLNAADEFPHVPEPVPGWEESWSFDFVTNDERLAGYARLTLRPAERTAWWWTAVVGAGRPYVLVREHEVTPPKLPSMEIRAAGLWAEPYCEEPFEHWSVGLEAFAIALDDPVEAYGAERGDPVPLGLDLGWEVAAEAVFEGAASYFQDCAVHGDVLLGRDRLPVAGTGVCGHAWGPPAWQPRDGVEVDARGLIAAPDPLYHAPLQLPAGRLARALCRLPDGRLRWLERLQPASSTLDEV